VVPDNSGGDLSSEQAISANVERGRVGVGRPTARRHVQATSVVYIGKEANKLEEQYCLGLDEAANIQYGTAPNDRRAAEAWVREGINRFGRRAVAMSVENVTSGCESGGERCKRDQP
jgi:hypothetical protein